MEATARKLEDFNFPEAVSIKIQPEAGCLHADFTLQEGLEGTFTVYSITGQVRMKRRIISPGHYEFNINLRKGVYVATLISGKGWSAKRVIIK
jgi:hypothetical protein